MWHNLPAVQRQTTWNPALPQQRSHNICKSDSIVGNVSQEGADSSPEVDAGR